MKTKLLMLTVFIAVSISQAPASTIFPDSRTATNAVELGVEGIARLCPTGMWNHWTFRDIAYDKESNTVVFVIQLNTWNAKRNDTVVTEEEAKKQTEWIVENIMEGYNELKKNAAYYVRRRLHAIPLARYPLEADGKRWRNSPHLPS